MPRLLERSTVLALAALVAFNVAMMVGWSAAGPSRDALVVAGWIAGDAVLCLTLCSSRSASARASRGASASGHVLDLAPIP